ncbi:hypothetical protein EL22_20935 [Halostagnicola sp. A56]|uniref:nuclear transport factor 2 family protein n=1 Tax=Halostagnicola sp. A56 TaxID=1495067 RepID=UPI00049F58F0|nr:nuclear transport factor 2 family protein [Halostagnicola sp. A56]KDE60488.1 hypothetical protein EL22_20935 [Halostagnicola sp. A56]
MTVEDTVREYYETLRRGGQLESYFLEAPSTTKFGVSESLFGYDAVADALAEQTETTDDWTVDSHDLVATDHGAYATVADEVTLAWTDTQSVERWRFETRWSGTLERRDGDAGADWRFRTMHVSAPHQL